MRLSSSSRSTSWRHIAALAACAALVAWAGDAHGQSTLTWGISGTGGTGSWTSSGTNWWNGTTNVAWTNNSIAWIVGPGNATTTVSGFTPTVSGITLNPSGNVILTGGTIALASATTPITSLAASNQIGSQLTGVGMGMVTSGGITFTGSNTYTGPTVMTGGMTLSGANGSIVNTSSLTITGGSLLQLAQNTVNNNRLSDTADVILSSGNIRTGALAATSTWSETAGPLKIAAGQNVVYPQQSGSTGQTSTLTFASLDRTSGATAQFGSAGAYAGLGVNARNRILFTTNPTLTNGIIGGWAIHSDVPGNNWATYDASNGVQALATYQTGTESSWASTYNVGLTATQTLTASRTINSLLISNTASSVTLHMPATRNLTLGTGGLLITGNNTNQVTVGTTGGGTITAGTSGAADLVIHQSTTARVDFHPVVTDNAGGGAVSFVGNVHPSGYIFWWNAGTYSGDTVLNSGRFSLRSNNLIPSGAGKGNLIVRTSGTLDMYGTNQTVNGLLGEGAVSLTTSGTSTLSVGANNTSSSFSGSLNDGASSGRVVALTKIGTGTLTLSGSSTYSGTTAVQAGAVRFTSLASGTTAQGLGSGSVVNLGVAGTSSGEIDYFGVTSGTFDKNVFALGNGRNRIRNSGSSALTLSGTLTKNGTILELAGGTFTVTGQITGASANSDLYVNGANVTLTNANNDYNGPTYVYGGGVLALGTNNVIPTGSVVTLGATGGGDTGTGTLSVGSFSDALGGLNFGSAGGTLRMTASATGATAQLTAATGTMALAGGTLDLTGSGTTAGLYRLLSAQSITGAFSGTTGLSAAYQLLTTGSTVNLQQRAVLGTVAVTNPTVSIITGGSAAFSYTVANTALSGGASLTFTGTGLSNVVGSSLGSADAANTSSAISGLVFTGTSVGNAQQGTFTIDAPSAFGSTTSTGTVSVNVLDHALPGFVDAGITDAYTQPTLNINFGSIDPSAGTQSFTYSLTNLASQLYGAGLTASLDFLGVTADGNGFASGLTTFNGLAAGGTSSLFTFTFTPGGQGSFNKTFTLQFSDNRNLSGAAATRDLTINAQVVVVPEPAAIALAGIGIAAAGWVAHKRRRSP